MKSKGFWRRVIGHDEFLKTPPFAEGYPKHPELAEAVAMLVRGNHYAARQLARKVQLESSSPEVQAGAADLLTHLQADPIAPILLVLAAILLVALTVFGLVRSRELRDVSKAGQRLGPQTSPSPVTSKSK